MESFDIEEDDEGVFRVVGVSDGDYILFEPRELGRFLTQLIAEVRDGE